MVTLSNTHDARTRSAVTDQSRLARSRLLVADAFTRARTDTEADPHELATWLLDQLQDAGWKAPPDPAADVPPLRPDQPADENSPGRQALRTGLCTRYGHPDPTANPCGRCGARSA